MSPKRRNHQGRARQSALVNRLNRKHRRDPFHARGWLRVDPARVQGVDGDLARRMLVTSGFVLALLIGATAGPALVASWQDDEQGARIHSVAVQGNARLSAETVALATGVARGSALAALDRHDIEAKLSAHPLIATAHAALLPDGQLVVRIEEREPRALLRSPGGDKSEPKWRLVDASGTPFAETRVEAWSRLPRLRSAQAFEDDAAAAPLGDAIELAAALEDPRFAALKHREIEVPAEATSAGWVIHTRGNPRRVLLGKEEVKPRLERLAMLLDAKLPEARTATEIDLRFAGQAVLRSRPASK